jgi:hypothetical protein
MPDDELIIDCRRLPGMGDNIRMRLSGPGIETWEDAMPEQVKKILGSRWACKLRVRVAGGQAEILGEAFDGKQDTVG